MRHERVALACASAAIATAVLTLAPSLSTAGLRASALVHVSTADALAPLAQRHDPGFVLVSPQAHYDGAYFYAIALDPFLRGTAHTLIDQSGYRYTRPMYGWIAGLVSLGQPKQVPSALLGVNLITFALAAWLLSVMAAALGRSPWWGLLVATSPGLLVGLSLDTHEPTALALVLGASLAWLRERRVLAISLFAIAAFTREYGLLLALGFAINELLVADGSTKERIKRVLPLAAGPLLYAGWWLYLRAQLGSWPLFRPGNVGAPLYGWLDSLNRAMSLQDGSFDRVQIGVAMVAIDVALLAALMIAVIRSVIERTRLRGVFVPLGILALSLNWWLLLYPKEALRVMAIPAVFAALTLLAPRQPSEGSADRVSTAPVVPSA